MQRAGRSALESTLALSYLLQLPVQRMRRGDAQFLWRPQTSYTVICVCTPSDRADLLINIARVRVGATVQMSNTSYAEYG